ncbi:hypothetical protein LIER_05252 [Lithospermum erythrorhizon]|uniref:C2 domain-containing protein n=1 Tax=Lithospermum erythrorhizon TaxID=34254 RepID=A0AAV3NZT9_LITER
MENDAIFFHLCPAWIPLKSVASPFKGASGVEKQNSNLFVESAGCLSRGNGVQRKETAVTNLGEILGVLEVFVHQAREIHNICIYHKQDVYAKVCLTSDPENAISTKTINGGGQNPVFNDRVQLNVPTIESSLKCEIYMLSRVKNYLEDQLLGFALVPLSEVLVNDGKLEQEFPLSSTELFHSPAGLVQLSLAYNGASPDVFEILAPAAYAHVQDMEGIASVPSQFDKIDNASGVLSRNTFTEPMASVNIELEPEVKQQDFVDMYMKSMQEITKSLEQLKLPLDITDGPTSSGNLSSNQKSETTPKNSGSKVFYGSRAFF